MWSGARWQSEANPVAVRGRPEAAVGVYSIGGMTVCPVKLIVGGVMVLGGSLVAPAFATSPALIINVANAPGWQAGHSYVVGDRVLAGPGWIAGSPGSFISGRPLYLWALAAGGGGTSASTGNGPQRCPKPANYGGGLITVNPNPSKWSGASTVSDGALTWTCLTVVDYPTWTAAVEDDSPLISGDGYHTWQPGTNYWYHQYAVSNGISYWMSTSENNPKPPFYCTSGSTPPSGFSTVSDGNCSWTAQALIPYSSQKEPWRHEAFVNGTYGGPPVEIQMDKFTNIIIWYGGKEAQVYQGGVGGENGSNAPLYTWYHVDGTTQENPVRCPNSSASEYTGCGFADRDPLVYVDITAASGDSFQDNILPNIGPLRVNPANGVTFYSDSSIGYTEAFSYADSYIEFQRLQFLSINGSAATGHGLSYAYNGGAGYGSGIYYLNDLFQAGGGVGAISCDAGCTYSNAVIIYSGLSTGGFAIHGGYGAKVENVTAIGPGSACATCTFLEIQSNQYGNPNVYNTAVFGFLNPFAMPKSQTPDVTAASNATDVLSGYAGGLNFVSRNDGFTYTTYQMPGVGSTCSGGSGSCYGISASSALVDATLGSSFDARIPPSLLNRPNSPLYGAGGAVVGESPRDILGSARPQSGRYDIGAYESVR